MDNVDLRLLARFRIAQRLNRGGGKELRALERLRAQVEEQRDRNVANIAVTRLADVIELRPRG